MRRRKLSSDQKKQLKLAAALKEKAELERLNMLIFSQALPLDAPIDYLERDPAAFYPASKR